MNRNESFAEQIRNVMLASDTLHILVSCESQSQLESYVGCFKELGHSVRAQRITAGKDLTEALTNPDWDLVIAAENHPELTPLQTLQLIRNHQVSIPCIVHMLGTENLSERDYLREGASDVITSKDDERLSLSGMRAISIRRDRRELEELRVMYEETARRCELLLATSNDAIGYLVDGMHVDTNEAYAELFGYADKTELAAIPMVDLISPDTQSEFKAALKRYRANPEDETAIEVTAVREDDAEFAAELVLSTASFEGEPCIQVLVRPKTKFVAATVAPTQLATTDAGPSAAQGVSGVEAMLSAISTAKTGQLLLLQIDDYRNHEDNLGVTGAWQLGQHLADFMAEQQQWDARPLRSSDAILGVCLVKDDPEHAMQEARSIIEGVAGHIFQIGEKSARCSLCAIVADVNSFESATEMLDNCCSALRDHAENAVSLRSVDSGRVQLLVAGSTGNTSVSGGVAALSGALTANEFSLSFQPIISLRGDNTEHYEVRIRHSGEDNQVISASDWLKQNHLSEKSSPLDRWSIEKALERLNEHLPQHPNTRLIVPLGAGCLGDEQFLPWLIEIIKTTSIPSESLVLQLHHQVVRSRLMQAEALAQVAREQGISLCVAGVSSENNPMEDLSLLKPALVRIDEKLVKALENYDETNKLIKPLIDALHHDQMASIMPGVEAAGALAVLWQLGVGYIQGDYMQAPSAEMAYDFADLA